MSRHVIRASWPDTTGSANPEAHDYASGLYDDPKPIPLAPVHRPYPALKTGAWLLALGAVALIAGLLAGCAKVEAKPRHRHTTIIDANGNVIGGRPQGCPHAYCGCGLRKYLGINDPRLDLAWNWARLFPRGHAGPGMAAVRHHHVMLIERMTGPMTAIVRDYNGGRHLSYIHERSLRGYVFVDPSARLAMR